MGVVHEMGSGLGAATVRDTEVPPTLAHVPCYFLLGLMFWFTRKKLSGSYLFLMETSRS